MAVIAPEPKPKKNGNPSSKIGWIILFFFIAVGVPFLLVKVLTGTQKIVDSRVESVSLAEDVSQDSIPASSASSSSQTAASSASQETSVASADQMKLSQDVASSSRRFDSKSSYYYSQKVKKDKKGVYELTGPVVDAAGIFSKSEYIELCDFILGLQNSYGVQIAVLVVPDMDGESIETYSMRHAEKWQLGQKGIDNGALLTVAMSEHDVRIEIGYGTEGTLTDAKCARIIRNILVPAFRRGDYASGIISAVKNMGGIIISDPSLITINNSAQTQDEDFVDPDNPAFVCVVVVLIIILLLLLNSMKGLRRRYFNSTVIHGSRAGYYPGAGRYSGSGDGSRGGGFGGGGGGFGGGGASGHW